MAKNKKTEAPVPEDVEAETAQAPEEVPEGADTPGPEEAPGPSCITRKLTTTERTMPKINMIPPIVGVPCLLLCHLGPMSRMVCPK